MIRAGLVLAVILLLMSGAKGLSVAGEAPFYQGKTVTIVEGRSAGGTASLRTQAVVKYLQKHLAGNPAFFYQYMPAGGGTAAANHVANLAKRDGLTIGNVGTAIYSNAIFDATATRYKLDDFVYLGSASIVNPITLIIRPGLELDTVEKLKAHEGLRFGNRSAGHAMYVVDRIFAFVLGLREPKWVLGYSDQEIELALERGEADAMVNNLRTLVQRKGRWLKEGFAFPVVWRGSKGRGAEVIPIFPQGRPTLDQYADTELKRGVIQLNSASRPGTASFFVHKQVPGEAIKALREAFDKVWNDPEFLREYERVVGEPAEPITGAEIEEVLRNIPRDPKVMEVYKQLVGAGPLPSAR